MLTAVLIIKNLCTLPVECMYVLYMILRIKCVNWFICVIEMENVFWGVGTQFLSLICMVFKFKNVKSFFCIHVR